MKNSEDFLLQTYQSGILISQYDTLAVEEPLEIIIGYGSAQQRQRKTIAVTMRTPEKDVELALGFLFTEGVIFSKKQVANIRILDENRLLVDLIENVSIDLEKLNRHFYTTSSCGVCGKASLDAVSTQTCYFLQKDLPKISTKTLAQLSTQAIDNQSLFAKTGGVHASVLFNTEGVVLKAFEDVGRHNALDKLVGWAMQNQLLPLNNHLLWVSGRVSFELIQKATMAGIPIVAAVGAPSNLAVTLAEENNLTLIGFLRAERFNVYSGFSRIG